MGSSLLRTKLRLGGAHASKNPYSSKHTLGEGRCPLHIKSQRRKIVTRAGSEDEDAPELRKPNSLEMIIRRKHRQIEALLSELGDEGIEERMGRVREAAVPSEYPLSNLILKNQQQGKFTFMLEVSQAIAKSAGKSIRELAVEYVAAGGDALAVRTDLEDSSEGMKDLFIVTQAVRVPVFRRDWIIHPVQVVEAKEAGAAGVIGVINQVSRNGTPILSSYAASLGLEAPVEVVNTQEIDGMDKFGVPFYAINLSVGLSLSIEGVASKIAHGMLGKMPFGVLTMVGVRGVEEARRARNSGADMLYVKHEAVEAEGGDVVKLMRCLEYATDLDD